MNEFEKNKQKIELIKKARQQLNQEYLDQRTKDYTNWEIACDLAWKTNGTKLAFPPIPAFPTEDDVVARALVLYTAIYPPVFAPEPTPITPDVEQTPPPSEKIEQPPEKKVVMVDASSTDITSELSASHENEIETEKTQLEPELENTQSSTFNLALKNAIHQTTSPWSTYLRTQDKKNIPASSLTKG